MEFGFILTRWVAPDLLMQTLKNILASIHFSFSLNEDHFTAAITWSSLHVLDYAQFTKPQWKKWSLPSLKLLLNLEGKWRRYLILPVPVVFLLIAFTLQLSAQWIKLASNKCKNLRRRPIIVQIIGGWKPSFQVHIFFKDNVQDIQSSKT